MKEKKKKNWKKTQSHAVMNMNKVDFANQENTTITNKIEPINLPDAPQFLIEISPMLNYAKSTMNLFMH